MEWESDHFKCSECGGELIEEGLSGIYFCSNCKAMFFKNQKGKFEVRKAYKVEEAKIQFLERNTNDKTKDK